MDKSEQPDKGAKLAERTAAAIGSWSFVRWQTIIMVLWVVWNTLGPIIRRFDQFPFVFLNLAMSAEAAFTGPILLIAANVSAIRDRKLAEKVAQLVEQNVTLTRHVEAVLQQNATLTEQNAAIIGHVETLVEQVAKLVTVDHEEHGRLLRELHAHTVCSGHTIIQSKGESSAA